MTQDLATTLVLVVATPEFVVAAEVGDGAVVARDEGGSIVTLTVPQSGEYLNETTFLTSPDAVETAQTTIWQGAAIGLAALTDGLQMLALSMPGGAPHIQFFAPLFSFAAAVTDEAEAQGQLTAFLLSSRIRERS